MFPLPRVLVALALAGGIQSPTSSNLRNPLPALPASPALPAVKWNGPLAAGLSWYLQSHVAERLFDARFQIRAYALDSSRYFGGFIPWEFRGLYLGRASRALERDIDPGTGRVAMAFATLERQLGWPVLQRALRVIAERPERENLDATTFIQIASDAAGQDLTWFTAMLDESDQFDNAIGELSRTQIAECQSGPCYRTTVGVERRGNATFPSSVRVTFADGQQVTANWNGQGNQSLIFESPAPPTEAVLDPDRVLLLDANVLNNRRTTAPATDVPVAKWTARWLVWLQDAMLTYGFLF